MKIASIIYNFVIILQCPGTPACCAAGTCCGTPACTGGPPPPPGFPIDNSLYLLFFAAIFLGAYVITKKLKKT